MAATPKDSPGLEELEALRRQVVELQRVSSLGVIAGSVCHELNNALTPILSYAKLGLRNPDPEFRRKAFEKILDGAQRATAIAGGVLGLVASRQADIGIAVGSGSDIAAETAGIVLVNSNPKDIANLILFGKATYRKMIQNLAWATGYNIVALPLAAGVLYSYGILLSPAAGAVLMSLSTVIVAINAGMLRIKKANMA